jgi:hypothetical protein
MGGTDEITVEDKTFRIFRRLPYRLGAEYQRLLISSFKEVDAPLADLNDITALTAKTMSSMDMKAFQLAGELLLTQAVISPNISEELLADYGHELQPYLAPLAERLHAHYAARQKKSRPSSDG